MNSKLFNSMGLDIDPGVMFILLFVFLIILFAAFVSLLMKYSRLKTSYDVFMKGRGPASMEEEIKSLFDDITLLKVTAEKNKKDIGLIIEDLRETYQRVGIVKYDAFKEMGGKLSFSIALLNDNRTGFILNSVHSSDGCYVYTKEIIDGESPISLGDEEKKALMLALQGDSTRYN
ncbi:MAG: DUF4446 family protein [Lachnospiraceae bacterium]|nr:DUF4446 family protein [Lachnospiraceae bacterium]MBR6485713.1 DUF4446 family protein [Lachnospiraceae bacterium]